MIKQEENLENIFFLTKDFKSIILSAIFSFYKLIHTINLTTELYF